MFADIVLRGNAIFDSIHDDPFEGFVAIKGNKICSVGNKHNDAKKWISVDTQVYDFNDKLIMPGFFDSHIHLLLSALSSMSVDLKDSRSEEEAVQMLVNYENEHPSEGWVFGFGWYNFYWDDHTPPSKKSIDQYFPDRPVLLFNSECHGIWVNSKALEICNIDKDTPDPAYPIARFADGEPTGVLDEFAAAAVVSVAYELPLKVQEKYLRNFMKIMSEYGITSIMDVQPLFGVEMSLLKSIKYLEEIGELGFRAHIAGSLFKDMAIHNARRKILSTDMVRFDYLKEFVEGIFYNHTCLLLEDYANAPGDKGHVSNDLALVEQFVMEAHRCGYTIKLHAQADRAVRLCLDFYERAINKYGPHRHCVEHAEIVDFADRLRFKKLDVIPSMQPECMGLCPQWEGHGYRVALGDERAWKAWPVKSMLDAAGVVAFGSDCPVQSVNPFHEISRSITRLTNLGLPEGGWNPKERLTLSEALKCYTWGSAYGASREKEIGTLSPGKFADIAVIDHNLFHIDPLDIRNAKAAMTIVDGKIVFTAGV